MLTLDTSVPIRFFVKLSTWFLSRLQSNQRHSIEVADWNYTLDTRWGYIISKHETLVDLRRRRLGRDAYVRGSSPTKQPTPQEKKGASEYFILSIRISFSLSLTLSSREEMPNQSHFIRLLFVHSQALHSIQDANPGSGISVVFIRPTLTQCPLYNSQS